MPELPSRFSPAAQTILGAFAFQAGLLSLAFATSRAAGRWASSLNSDEMKLLLSGGILLAVIGAVLVGIAGHRAAGARRVQFHLPLAMTAITGLLCVLAVEAAVRIVAVPDPLGQRVGNTILIPYDWPALARHSLEALAKDTRDSALFIPDPELGWTIGPSRLSENGLYASSAEGLRSRKQDEREADSEPGKRIALFGDSFAFSEEVTFEDSLANKLEAEIGNGAQVLNFGVPGYGADQAILRFEQAKAEWSPPVAILTFIEDDLVRTANVYTFLKVSWGVPMSKPRFILRDEDLELLNSPALAGPALFDRPSIFDLPLLEHDIEFIPERWSRHPLHASYFLRLLNGLFPVWPPTKATASEDVIVALNARLIHDFSRSARAAGITPVIAYLPTDGDYADGGQRNIKKRVLPALAAKGVPVADMTPCFADHVHRPDVFMPQGHYTGYSNQLIAECLAPLIQAAMASRETSGELAGESPATTHAAGPERE